MTTVIIYIGKSDTTSDLARREKVIRDRLTQLNVDHIEAIVVAQCTDTTQGSCSGVDQVSKLIEDKPGAIIALEDMSQLSWTPEGSRVALQVIHDGGRLISSVGDFQRRTSPTALPAPVHKERALRMRLALEARLQKPEASVGDHPFGYTLEKLEAAQVTLPGRPYRIKNKVVIDPGQAEVVRQIFSLYADNCCTFTEIAKQLISRAIPTARHSSACRWKGQRIHAILQNRKYIGDWTWGVSHAFLDHAGRHRLLPSTLSKPVVCSWPERRIIDQVLWDRVQLRLHRRNRLRVLDPVPTHNTG